MASAPHPATSQNCRTPRLRSFSALSPSWEDVLKLIVDGSWSGWEGDTIVQLTNGSVWRQDEYYYEYHYAYRPEVFIASGKMTVKGMRKAIRVRRIS